MKRYPVAVQPDHLERLAKARRPVVAVAELIWNSLDADAHRIDVSFHRELLQGITKITVKDDGLGITELDASDGFTRLGGSWKRNRNETKGERRELHGKEGKGRFAAFSLGTEVTWDSIASAVAGNARIVIRGRADDLLNFEGEEPSAVEDAVTGTTVTILGVREAANRLDMSAARSELTELFAFYLKKYPGVEILVDGRQIDPEAIQLSEVTYSLDPLTVAGNVVSDAKLTIVEWAKPMSKSLHFCDNRGFTLHSATAGIRAPGFEFSAFVLSAYVRELYDNNEFGLADLSEGVTAVQDAAKARLKEHIRTQRAGASASLVDEWKRLDVYPFAGEPSSTTELTERQVFDILAANVQEFAPDFAAADKKTKQLSFRLLKHAVETNPESMQRILVDVLGLPKDKQNELAELLQRTSLSAVISAATLVATRLDVLRALEVMVFDDRHAKTLLERSQLQRILADHSWIFGEQYHLAVDDQSLTEVLIAHRQLIGDSRPKRADRKRVVPVKRLDGKDGIVDMMLSKVIAKQNGEDREHLVIELKRPIQKIDGDVLRQVTDYALAVAADSRFRDVGTKWVFVAVSAELDDHARRMTRQTGKPRGVYATPGEGEFDITIVAKTWGEIINECKGRMRFFQQQLEWTADRAAALESLRRTHGKYFPSSVIDELNSASTEDTETSVQSA